MCRNGEHITQQLASKPGLHSRGLYNISIVFCVCPFQSGGASCARGRRAGAVELRVVIIHNGI